MSSASAWKGGHCAVTVLLKGAKIVTVPLAPRTTRAVDLAVG